MTNNKIPTINRKPSIDDDEEGAVTDDRHVVGDYVDEFNESSS